MVMKDSSLESKKRAFLSRVAWKSALGAKETDNFMVCLNSAHLKDFAEEPPERLVSHMWHDLPELHARRCSHKHLAMIQALRFLEGTDRKNMTFLEGIALECASLHGKVANNCQWTACVLHFLRKTCEATGGPLRLCKVANLSHSYESYRDVLWCGMLSIRGCREGKHLGVVHVFFCLLGGPSPTNSCHHTMTCKCQHEHRGDGEGWENIPSHILQSASLVSHFWWKYARVPTHHCKRFLPCLRSYDYLVRNHVPHHHLVGSGHSGRCTSPWSSWTANTWKSGIDVNPLRLSFAVHGIAEMQIPRQLCNSVTQTHAIEGSRSAELVWRHRHHIRQRHRPIQPLCSVCLTMLHLPLRLCLTFRVFAFIISSGPPSLMGDRGVGYFRFLNGLTTKTYLALFLCNISSACATTWAWLKTRACKKSRPLAQNEKS